MIIEILFTFRPTMLMENVTVERVTTVEGCYTPVDC